MSLSSNEMETSAPKDLSHYYSTIIRHTAKSEIKQFYKYFLIPGIGNLAGGLPDPNYFPYETLEANAALPNRFKPTPNEPVRPGSPTNPIQTSQTSSFHITVPHDSPEVDRTRKIDLATALQYGTSEGYPPLLQWVKQFTTTKLHPIVPYTGGVDVVLTCGNTDGLAKVLHVFSNVWDDRKDWQRERQGVLCEEFAYMNAVQAIQPRGLNIVPVAVDGQGMLAEGPGGLRDVLENWDRSRGKIPHLMYTVTVGQNPTSGVLSIERKKQIYALCQKYDILIIEDDPYWYLQYPSANALSTKYRTSSIVAETLSKPVVGDAVQSSSGSAFLDSLVPSYIAVDFDGRVLRLDTFSKTIAPGCRLGWITAQPKVIEQITGITAFLTQQPSGFVQSMVAELLIGQQLTSSKSSTSNKGNSEISWQMDGWIRWLEGLRGNYERRMQLMSEILEKGKYKISAQTDTVISKEETHEFDSFEVVSRTQMYDFVFPMGGMFLWARMQYESHPLFNNTKVPIARLSHAFWIFLTTEAYRVLLAPGTMFSPTDKIRDEKGPYYFRICFAAVADEVVKKTSENFVRACNDFFDIKDAQKITDIIDSDANSADTIVGQAQAGLDGISLSGPTWY